MPQVVWTVAGFDPSSGAGITADLATFAAHGLFGCSAITALTVQSTRGVTGVEVTRAELLGQMLAHLQSDLPAAGIKIGMLASAKNAEVLRRFLASVRCGEKRIPIVLDPVLRSSSGRDLLPPEEIPRLRKRLLPWVDVITPNWSELSALAGQPVRSIEGAVAAARQLIVGHSRLSVVVTGGDQAKPVDLLVTHGGEAIEVPGERIETQATHGTGCAFSSSLLANLVLGASLPESTHAAKRYVAEAMRRAPGVGGGKGPLGLLWPLGSRTATAAC